MKGTIVLHAGVAGPRCRLGAIVADQHGYKFGLSAEYILTQSSNEQIYNSDGGMIGRVRKHVIAATNRDGESVPFIYLIGRFELTSNAAELLERNLEPISRVDPQSGQHLNWHSADGKSVKLTVIARGGEVAFRRFADDVDPQYYANPIILVFNGSEDEPRPGAGDAGSLLSDNAGDAVALLLSTDGSRYYAAGLAEYVDHFGLRAVHQQTLLPTPQPLDRDRFNEITSIAQAAVVNLFTALREADAVHADPAGNNIPAGLLRELEDLDL